MSFAHSGLRRRLAFAACVVGPRPVLLGPPTPAVGDEPPTRARPVGTEAVRRTAPPFRHRRLGSRLAVGGCDARSGGRGAPHPPWRRVSAVGMVPALADAVGPLAATSVAAGSAGLAAGAAAESTFGGTGRATPRWLSRDSSGRDELATRNPRGHGAMPETEGNLTAPRPHGPAAISAYATVEGLPPEKYLTRPW